MPHKVRKLVVHGPKDSGKTSWINVLLGIIPMTDVASITQERQLAAAMIEEHTQLVVLDEWSEYTLQLDMAKSVLQGGFMVKSVKHKTAKCIENKSSLLHYCKSIAKLWFRGYQCAKTHCLLQDIFTSKYIHEC